MGLGNINMKNIITGLSLLAITLAVIIVFYIFRQETVSVGKYNVLYYINQCDIPPELFPQDLPSLMNLPGLIRITWEDEIADQMFQMYCYLPGKGIEKSGLHHKK
jgi:hypothetical protein